MFVNVYVMRALFCQPVFSIFEFYASNYASVFTFSVFINQILEKCQPVWELLTQQVNIAISILVKLLKSFSPKPIGIVLLSISFGEKNPEATVFRIVLI